MTPEEKNEKPDHWMFLSESLDGFNTDENTMRTEQDKQETETPQEQQPRRRGRPRKRPLEAAEPTAETPKRRGRKRKVREESEQLPLEAIVPGGEQETRVDLTIGDVDTIQKPRRRGRRPASERVEQKAPAADPWTVLASQIGEIGTAPAKPATPPIQSILPEIPVVAPAPGDPALEVFFAGDEEPLEIDWGKPPVKSESVTVVEESAPSFAPARPAQPELVKPTLDPAILFTAGDEEPLTIDWGRSPKKAAKPEAPAEPVARAEETMVEPGVTETDRGRRDFPARDRGERNERNDRGERRGRRDRNDRSDRNDRRDRDRGEGRGERQERDDRSRSSQPSLLPTDDEQLMRDVPVDVLESANTRGRRGNRNRPEEREQPVANRETVVNLEKESPFSFEEPADRPQGRDAGERGRGRRRGGRDTRRDDLRKEEPIQTRDKTADSSDQSFFKFASDEEFAWPAISEDAEVVRDERSRSREPRRDRSRSRDEGAAKESAPESRGRGGSRSPAEPRPERPGLSWDDAILNVVQFNLDRHGNRKK
ncbi:MAG: hypothetical protein Q4G68_00155 [Planctomycetia bacterium]|nr:hypothetical protein [Planctomycetia bacterium]